jgi:hypothetical protein
MRTYSIVGMNYIKTEDIVAALKPGTAVTLVREPNNEFDKNAIAVWVDGQRVGYIPKKTNEALAGFIDQTGEIWDEPIGVAPALALDSRPRVVGMKSIPAVFIRSPNSGYPMVSV